MIRDKVAIAGALLAVLAVSAFDAHPAQAGTCVPVTVKGRAADPATATTKASIKLTQRAAALRGRIKNSSTNCQKGPPGGFVVYDLGDHLPMKSLLSGSGDTMVTCRK
jgi:hypothetical protein